MFYKRVLVSQYGLKPQTRELWSGCACLDGGDKGGKTLLVSRDERNTFKAAEITEQLERRVEMRSGDIQSSLFVATDKALIPSSVADQIIKMFETNVDFRKLQRGDYFNVVYETFWQNGEMVKTGCLLSGEFKKCR